MIDVIVAQDKANQKSLSRFLFKAFEKRLPESMPAVSALGTLLAKLAAMERE